jgi:FkbM family methyltransferase
MELFCNTSNRMTRWLASSGALKVPFVLLDVGVQGGFSPRWDALGDHLVVYGFDLLEEAIAPLVKAGSARKHYFAMGLADKDGELDIVIPANRCETQLYSSGTGERRRVQIRRLDTLLKDGLVEPADFIKMDCEGFEPIILRGAADYLAASNLIGADVESSFNLSPLLPSTQFSESCDPLVHQRLMVFDIQFNRVAVSNLQLPAGICRPATLNVLFARNLPQELNSPSSFAYRAPERPADPQTVLKSVIVLESYGLLDWAHHVLQTFSGDIGAGVDVDKAVAELRAGAESVRQPERQPGTNFELISAREAQIRAMERSLSWRITAPMRSARRLLSRLQNQNSKV